MQGRYGRTRERLRKSIGGDLIGHRLIISAATAAGDKTGLIDDSLMGGDDNYIGWWFAATSSGGNGGSIRRVSDYDSSAGRLSWSRSLAKGTAIGDEYELWPSEHSPAVIHDYINQAIGEAAGHVYEPVEDVSLHAGGGVMSFPVPEGIDAITKVEVRTSAASVEIHRFGRVFDERTAAGWKQAVAVGSGMVGSSSLMVGIPTGAKKGEFMTDSVGPLNLSSCTHVEGWVRSERTLKAGDVVVHLNGGSARADGSDAESLSLPKTEAGRWTYFRAALKNPFDDSAISSVGIEYNANVVAGKLWFGSLRAVDEDTAAWRKLPAGMWRIERGNRVLRLTGEGRRAAGAAPLKLIGGREPSALRFDTSASVVPDEFIMARATALGALHLPESGGEMWEAWAARTRAARASFPLLTDIRRVA